MIRESGLSPDAARHRQVVPAGEYWFDVVRQGQRFRIVDVEGNQAADTLMFCADDPAERYSFVDTLRAQCNVYLSVGSTLLSTEGRALAEIVADTVGRHDTLGGACASESNTVRYALEKRIEETGAVITAQPLPKVQGDTSQMALVFQNQIGNCLQVLSIYIFRSQYGINLAFQP